MWNSECGIYTSTTVPAHSWVGLPIPHSAFRIPHSKTLAPHPTRGPHGSDHGLPPVGSQKRPRDRLGNLLFTLPSSPFPPPEQYDDRPAPARAREPRAVRPGSPRRRDHKVELRGAALVQPAARFVGLVQQPPERLEAAAREQLGAEARAGGLADHVQRPRAQRLGEGLLEAP